MLRQILPAIAGLTWLAGCASRPFTYVPGNGHPAHAGAAPSPAVAIQSPFLDEETNPPIATGDAAHADHPSVDAAGADAYSCPMHPEVVQSGPGRCPKCNMRLELQEAAKDGGATESPAKKRDPQRQSHDHGGPHP